MIDTRCAVETPEGVELEYSPAGPAPRTMAWFADAVLRGLLYLAVAPFLGFLGRMGIGLILIFMFLLEWFYPVAFEVLNRGQTPGKKMMNLRVLRTDGAPVGWTHASIRSLLAFADFLPFGFVTGLTAIFLSRKAQRLGDLAAGTVVVHVQPKPPAPARSGDPGPNWAPPVPLTLPEQSAIIGFADRAPGLTVERARELANLLEPLTGVRDDEGVLRLQALARNLRGLP